MRSRFTACKFLFISPAMFLMLQISMVLPHHHTCSYHDSQASFHSISTFVDKQAGKIDSVIGLQYQFPQYCSLVTDNVPRFQHSPEAVAFTTPSHSRAPPTTRVQRS